MSTNEKRTLGKTLKIQNVGRQKRFFEKKLNSFLNRPTEGGDITFVYKGAIFTEVRDWLKEQGFTVTPLKPATAIGYFQSIVVSIITISDDPVLTDEEMEESTQYADGWNAHSDGDSKFKCGTKSKVSKSGTRNKPISLVDPEYDKLVKSLKEQQRS